MAGPRDNRTLRPSLFDSLCGEHQGPSTAGTVAQLRRSVLRNVEWILGTRQTSPAGLERFPYARDSILAYGLPDLALIDIADPSDRQRVAEMVAQCIRRFEPRLRRDSVIVEDVTVRAGEQAAPAVSGEPPAERPRAIRLQVRGTLAIAPYQESIAFDTTITAQSGDVQVKAME